MKKVTLCMVIAFLNSGCATLLHGSKVASEPMRMTPDEVSALPPGALITVVSQASDEAPRTAVGTVLKSGPEGVILANCRHHTSEVS